MTVRYGGFFWLWGVSTDAESVSEASTDKIGKCLVWVLAEVWFPAGPM